MHLKIKHSIKTLKYTYNTQLNISKKKKNTCTYLTLKYYINFFKYFIHIIILILYHFQCNYYYICIVYTKKTIIQPIHIYRIDLITLIYSLTIKIKNSFYRFYANFYLNYFLFFMLYFVGLNS